MSALARQSRSPGPDTRAEAVLGRATRRPVVLALAAGVLAAFGYLAHSAFAGSVVYYRTPTEVAAQPDQRVRLSGTVLAGSIVSANGWVGFSLTDGSTTIPVRYQGAPPTALRDGGQAVADGVYRAGLFHADSLLAKCPSRFDSSPGSG